jgi:NhaA family Na+:H+ antiporter
MTQASTPRRPTPVRPDARIGAILNPFQRFVAIETASGLVLLAAAFAALVWANSPWRGLHADLLATPLSITFGGFDITKPLLLWINDGLMAVFFFVVGLEIKREVIVGELTEPRKAALPIAAAIGGMLAPALVYSAINLGGPHLSGWGTPVATDIAFALGVLALLGRRVPASLKVFLTALAIVDDLGAILVIALFYTPTVEVAYLGYGLGFLVLLVILNRLGVRRPLPYALLGFALWLAFLKSGVHATIAGVLLAMTIPAHARIDASGFVARVRGLLDAFESRGCGTAVETSPGQKGVLLEIESAVENVETPLARLEHALLPWSSFVVLPLFALANAGVQLSGDLATVLRHPVTIGIALGLFLGNQTGITLVSWLAVRSGLARLPSGVTWRHVYGIACLAGMGFTLSLFIASLAFPSGELLEFAKVGILGGSIASGLLGIAVLWNSSATGPDS